jgi:hypothetical protein
MKRYNSKLTSSKFIALFISTGTGLFSLSQPAFTQEAAPAANMPAIVLRPASHQATDCEIELDKPQGSSGYRLLINIPDSVSTIEVAPSTDSQRRFRIRMDDPSVASPATGESASLKNSANAGKLELNLRRPIDAMADVKWIGSDSTNAPVDSSPNAAVNVSADQTDNRSTASRFVANPFFSAPAVAEIVAPARLAENQNESSGRRLKAQPVTIDEVIHIKTVSLATSQEAEADSIATAFSARPASNVDSISVAPMPTEMLEASTDFTRLKMPAPSLADVEYFTDLNASGSADSIELGESLRQEPAVDLTTTDLPELANSPRSALALPVNVAVAGPENLTVGSTYDFTITVLNESMIGIEDLSLAIATPGGVDVTVIEKPADFDAVNRTLTWQLPRIEAGDEVVFRYKISTTAAGQFQQKTVLWQGKNVSATISSNIRSEN